jgi:uncharacterized protein (DUF4415 family)
MPRKRLARRTHPCNSPASTNFSVGEERRSLRSLNETMKKMKAVDFSKERRGAVGSMHGKTRITIYLDDAIIERFKALSEQTGKGYQTLINEALSDADRPLTTAQIRKILREELAAAKANR